MSFYFLRPLSIFALCFLLSCGFLACASDNETADKQVVATLSAQKSLILNLGGIEVIIFEESIGSANDQIPAGSKVSLSRIEDISTLPLISNASQSAPALSPSYRVKVTDPDGNDISDRSVTRPHRVSLFADPAKLKRYQRTTQEVIFLHTSGSSLSSLTFGQSISTDTNYIVDSRGMVAGDVSHFSDFVLLAGETIDLPPDDDPDDPDEVTPLSGTLNQTAGLLAFNLSDPVSGDGVGITMPEGLATGLPATITFNITTVNPGNLLDPNNRAVIVTSGATQFTSFNIGGNVTMELTTFDGSASSGTLQGQVIDGDGQSFTLDHSFTTSAGEATLTSNKDISVSGAELIINATVQDASASAAVFNGNDYVALWLSGTSGANLTLQTRRVDTAGSLLGSEESITPGTVNFVATNHLRASYASNNGANGRIMVVGATSNDSDGIIGAVMLDEEGAALAPPTEFQVTSAGRAPRLAYNAQSNKFIVAYMNASNGIELALFDPDGTQSGSTLAITSDTTQILRGLASAGGNSEEVLITFSDNTGGVLGRRVDSANDSLLGSSNITFSTAGSGGATGFELVGSGFLVTVVDGTQTQVLRLEPGQDTPSQTANISLAGTLDAIVGGPQGALLISSINIYQGLESDANNPLIMDPILVPVLSSISPTFHSAPAPPGVAANSSNEFLVVGVDATNGGIRAFRIQITGP